MTRRAHKRVPRKCPTCRTPSDETGSMNGADTAPVPGAVLVCLSCGMLEVMRESGQLSKMTADEWTALDDADRAKLLAIEDGRRRAVGG